jgi:hypothetical protein|tara:strand:+ start:4681 stop:5562 length:882 start_codon:yes stop_codon:yes gene_type:complete
MKKLNVSGQWLREETPADGDPGTTISEEPGRQTLAPEATTEAAAPGFDYNPEAFGEADPSTGRPSNLPEKYWNNETKTINAPAMLERHNTLESKLGSFAGAPDEYTIPDTMFPEGSGMESDETLVEQFSEIAKKHNMSQELYEELMTLQVGSQLAGLQNQTTPEDQRVAEIAKLGDDGERQIGVMTTAFENSISELPAADKEALLQGYRDAVVSASTAKFVQHLMGAAKTVNLPNFNTPAGPGMSRDELDSMNGKLDEKSGKRLVETDPAYRKQVDQAFKDYYGAGPNRQVIG